MNYTLHFTRLTLATVFGTLNYYLAVLVSGTVFGMIAVRLSPLFENQAAVDLVSGQLVYTLLSTGVLIVFMCAHPVFSEEKRQGIVFPLLCSPAGAGEMLLGKSLGVAIAAIPGALAAFLLPLTFFPLMLKAMFAGKVLFALLIIFGQIFAYTVISGMLLLCFYSPKIVYPALFFTNYIPVLAQKYLKSCLETHGLAGANWLNLASLAALLLLTFGLYKLYFSKARITASA
jgi:ABC-type transport system involved in multi-copper enzyme maturation permease subunit